MPPILHFRQEAQACYCEEESCKGYIGGDNKSKGAGQLVSSDDEGNCILSFVLNLAGPDDLDSEMENQKRNYDRGNQISQRKDLNTPQDVLLLVQKLRIYSYSAKVISKLLKRLLVFFLHKLL